MKKTQKKSSAEVATPTDDLELSSTTDNSTTKGVEMSMDLDEVESQKFRADGNYEKCMGDEVKARHWCFIVYKESAPADWIEQLVATGLPFSISDEHDKDENPDGSHKKDHFHGILSYANTTTYANASKLIRSITNGPYPQKCQSVSGAYAYFRHKWNPEKYQYDGKGIRRFNGWEKALESTEVSHIMNELTAYIFNEDIQEYSEFMVETMAMDGDYMSVAMNHTVYFNALIRSYRHNPARSLMRYYNNLPEGELKAQIEERITLIQQQEVEAC